MAFFAFSALVAAGAQYTPLEITGNPWKFRRAPFDGMIEVMHRSVTTGVVVTINTGSEEIQQESLISGGGVAGVFTGRLNLEPVTFAVKAGDEITLRYRNTAGAAINVDGTIEYTPRKG